MKPQKSTATLKAFRIGDPSGDYPIWDATGSTIYPGRWNDRAHAVIYASANYSTAMLEKLVHLNGIMPDGQHFIEVTIPAGTLIETVTGDHLPGWAARDMRKARAYGRGWANAKRSAVLRVPSYVARMEWNFVFNPAHDEFARIHTAEAVPVWWDKRLFLD